MAKRLLCNTNGLVLQAWSGLAKADIEGTAAKEGTGKWVSEDVLHHCRRSEGEQRGCSQFQTRPGRHASTGLVWPDHGHTDEPNNKSLTSRLKHTLMNAQQPF